jgi:hypothetical protein
MRSIPASCLRALPLLTALATAPALAEPVSADIAQLLQGMQARLSKLEARNAELERRLADAAPAARDEALKARVEDLEHEVLAISRKPDPLERFEGLSAGASLTMVAQRATGGTTTGRDESQFNYRADVEVEMPAGEIGDAAGRLFAHFRLGQGNGLANLPGTLTGTTNSTAFELAGPGIPDDSTALLAQAWYQLDIPVGAAEGTLGRVEVTVGKIDPFVFFDGNNLADDESEAFLNNVFVHNPLLDSGGDVGVDAYGFTPGVRVAYVNDVNGKNQWGASLGVFGSGNGATFSNSFNSPFVIGQMEYNGEALGGRDGSYRFYAWNNGRGTDQTGVNPNPEKHSGWGLSLDQQVTDSLGLFTRVGLSTRGRVNFDEAFTLGGQLSGEGWGRADDRIGIAIGLLNTSSEYQAANPGFSGAEKQAELFYVWQFNEQFHLSPSVQWIGRPGGDPAADNITVVGLRAKATY